MIAAIIAAIEANQLGTGDKLPSIRGLSAQLGINPNTTARVYRELELRGFIESKAGSGSFVLPRDEEAAAREKAARMQALYSDMLHEARAPDSRSGCRSSDGWSLDCWALPSALSARWSSRSCSTSRRPGAPSHMPESRPA